MLGNTSHGDGGMDLHVEMSLGYFAAAPALLLAPCKPLAQLEGSGVLQTLRIRLYQPQAAMPLKA